MAWEDIEERLKEAFKVSISFPAGTIWLPETHLSIDDWLTSIAQTDEEYKELEIPRLQFLQNRWPIEQLLLLEWDDEFSNRRSVEVMHVGQRAYILFSDWNEHVAIAAIEPENPSLYREIVGKLLENRSFVPSNPTHIRNRRADLLPDLTDVADLSAGQPVGTGGTTWTQPALETGKRWKAFLSEILVGWIGKWIHAPEEMLWDDQTTESGATREGKIVMSYKPSDRPRQGEKQKGKK